MHSISRKAALIFRSSPGKSGASSIPVWQLLDRNHSHDACKLCLISLMFLCWVGPSAALLCRCADVQLCRCAACLCPSTLDHTQMDSVGREQAGARLATHPEHCGCCLCWSLGQHISISPELSWVSSAGWTCRRGICHQVQVLMLLWALNPDQGTAGKLCFCNNITQLYCYMYHIADD